MPPQPPGLCGEVQIPGATSDPPLRTHSSKFPVGIFYILITVFYYTTYCADCISSTGLKWFFPSMEC